MANNGVLVAFLQNGATMGPFLPACLFYILYQYKGYQGWSCAQYTIFKTNYDSMKTYTSERPHHCAKCDECFRYNSHLTVHMAVYADTRPCTNLWNIFETN